MTVSFVKLYIMFWCYIILAVIDLSLLVHSRSLVSTAFYFLVGGYCVVRAITVRRRANRDAK